MFLFLGILVSSTMWFVFLPAGYVEPLFNAQVETIKAINLPSVGNVIHTSHLSKVFLNNLRVLSICVLFSFLYGVGAMFILTWNATVIATAAGTFVRENISTIGSELGFVSTGKYFHLFSVGILKYMVHGFFEILAYFVAALAGGIISVAIIRHVLGSKKFEKILFDVSGLLILSVLLLFISALIEIFVTPRFF